MAIDYYTELTYRNAYYSGIMLKKEVIKRLIECHDMTESEAKEIVKYW